MDNKFTCATRTADAQFMETPDICDDKDNDCDGIVMKTSHVTLSAQHI